MASGSGGGLIDFASRAFASLSFFASIAFITSISRLFKSSVDTWSFTVKNSSTKKEMIALFFLERQAYIDLALRE
jgi:hypothetical protein